MGSLYKRVYRREFLWSAWRQIQENGRASKSAQTRKDVHEYSLAIEKHIEKIRFELKSKTYEFEPQHGILQQRPGKSARPIVKSPIENRIVQRSILDVLQQEKSIKSFFRNPTSFGGIKGKGVREAIELAYAEMKAGKQWYVRSDISEFFTKIPREVVLDRLKSVIDDDDFGVLLTLAVKTELSNMAELGANINAFPIHEVGIAQGCCLSPLFANALLADFDKELNTKEVTCIRYIDDFLILGNSEESVAKSFRNAQRILSGFNLRAYDPFKQEPKADFSRFDKGLDFLGCKILPGQIRPNDKSSRRLLDSINEIFDSSEQLLRSPAELQKKRKTYIETLLQARHVLLGWGNQYAYCNHPQFLSAIDKKIAEREELYTSQYLHSTKLLTTQDQKRAMGLHQLVDSKYDPIIKTPNKRNLILDKFNR